MTQLPDRTDYKQLLSFMMHEVRTTNAMIKDSARLLSLAIRGNRIDAQLIRHHVSTIVEQSSVLSSWLAIADFHVDPDRFAKEPRQRVSLHEIFYKSRSHFQRLTAQKHVSIRLYGSGKFHTKAHPIIDIVPYILLDNAVKYSPPYGTVKVSFSEWGDVNEVKVTSDGPYVDREELQRVCDIGYRGKHAQMASPTGSGQGLGLLTAICAYHEVEVCISSDDRTSDYNGIPYSEFAVVLHFKKA